ncbi:hypothetical protein [Sulfitobacter sp. PS-8MA]|uniref:hypothetical protein n=1 Tax=Sulfitobacter sp. PS-8MA TaxID=3237707 RepID=UPI0034C5B29A
MGDQRDEMAKLARAAAEARRRRLLASEGQERPSGMQTFEVQGADGTVYEVQAPDMPSAANGIQSMTPGQRGGLTDADLIGIAESEAMAAQGSASGKQHKQARRDALRRRLLLARQDQARKGQQANVMNQTMSGVNEGIGFALGFPVDAATSLINGMFAKPQYAPEMVAGPDGLPMPDQNAQITQGNQIANPVGGSRTFLNLLAPTISDTQPQTAGQRFGRRIGQEAGAMAIPGGLAMRGAKAPLRLGATEAASAVGAGTAGQVAQEVAPGNETADMIASMIGGLTPIEAARSLRPGAKAPTIDELKERQSAAYDALEASPARLSQESTQRLQDVVSGRAARDGMDPYLAPKASRTADKIKQMMTPRIAEVEKSRRLVGRDVAGALDPTESSIGMGMKDEITRYLDNLSPDDVTGGDPAAAVASLREGRDMTRRIKKSEDIEQRLYKAVNRRAKLTHLGGL